MKKLPGTTIGSRFGYSGSSRRIWALTGAWRDVTWKRIFGHPVAVLLILIAWMAVTLWYLVVIAIVGPLVAPFWLIRWGDRRREFREQQEDAALLRMMTGESESGANS